MTAPVLPTGDVIIEPGAVRGRLAAPASKSVTNRMLVIAALAKGRSRLFAPLDSDDTRAMRRLVTGLGAAIEEDGDAWVVTGVGGHPRVQHASLDAGLSGTTMRFGLALAALAETPVEVTGDAPLRRRPIGPLSQALRELGAAVDDAEGYPPARVRGPLRGGAVTVDVTGSSQYASALLLVAPATQTGVRLRIHGPAALAYLRLTLTAMRQWGAEAGDDLADCRVAPGRYHARDVRVEYDASAAAHLLTLAAATAGDVTITNVAADTLQPDAAFTGLLERMGAQVHHGPGTELSLSGPPRLRAAGRVDLGAMPDQLPNAAVLAALGDGVTELTGAAVVRGHETDRIAALASELGRMGVEVTERDDGLRIVGGGARGPVRLRTYDDHRMAMAFAALGARVPEVTIAEPWCARKTYPAFWQDLAALGVTWRERAT